MSFAVETIGVFAGSGYKQTLNKNKINKKSSSLNSDILKRKEALSYISDLPELFFSVGEVAPIAHGTDLV